MNKIKIVGIIVVVISLIVFLFFYYALPDKNNDVKYTVTEVSFKDTQSKLYIKMKTWGMTSDNQIVIISNSNKREFISEPAQDYVYKGIMPLFYKVQNDTLSIYTLKTSSIPEGLKTSLKVIQGQIENPEMMKLIEHDNYKIQGLTAVK